MDAPIVKDVAGVSKAFNVKSLFFIFLITIVMIMLLSFVMKQYLVIPDENGNPQVVGEIQKTFKWRITKNQNQI